VIVIAFAACTSKADGTAETPTSTALAELGQLKDQLCACSTMSGCGDAASDRFNARMRAADAKGPEVNRLVDQVHDCKMRLINSGIDTERCSPALQIAMERVLIDKGMGEPGGYKSTENNPWPKKIYDHCHDDRWPADVIRCMTAAETRVAFDRCVAAMPVGLRDKLGPDAALL
jgi:hypothetical protein